MNDLLPDELQRRFVNLDLTGENIKSISEKTYTNIVWAISMALTFIGSAGGIKTLIFTPGYPALVMLTWILTAFFGLFLMIFAGDTVVRSLRRRSERRRSDRLTAQANAVLTWWEDARRFLEERGIGSLVITEGVSRGQWKVRSFFVEDPRNPVQQVQIQESFSAKELAREVTPFVRGQKMVLLTASGKPLQAPYAAGQTRVLVDDRGTRVAVDAAVAEALTA